MRWTTVPSKRRVANEIGLRGLIKPFPAPVEFETRHFHQIINPFLPIQLLKYNPFVAPPLRFQLSSPDHQLKCTSWSLTPKTAPFLKFAPFNQWQPRFLISFFNVARHPLVFAMSTTTLPPHRSLPLSFRPLYEQSETCLVFQVLKKMLRRLRRILFSIGVESHLSHIGVTHIS